MLLQRVLGICLAAAVLAGGIYSSHRHTDAWAPRIELEDELLYLPSGGLLRHASLGYEMLVADLLWVKATAMFGEGYGAHARWQLWLYHMINLATDLDPEFRAAYKYGGTMLRLDGALVDQSNLIFQKGSEALPDEWYFPFAIAMNYFIYKEDRRLSARYMEKAAHAARRTELAMAAAREAGDLDSLLLDPRRAPPSYLANLAASLYSETEQLELGLTFLLEEQKQLPESAARTAVEVKILETRYLIALRSAESVVATYQERQGELPPSPESVAELGLSLPEDPLGGRWQWDASLDAEPGSLVSSRYIAVFSAIVRDTGLGVVGRGLHGEQGNDATTD